MINAAVVDVVRGETPDRAICPRCRGTGDAKTLVMGMIQTVDCPRCAGAGVVPQETR